MGVKNSLESPSSRREPGFQPTSGPRGQLCLPQTKSHHSRKRSWGALGAGWVSQDPLLARLTATCFPQAKLRPGKRVKQGGGCGVAENCAGWCSNRKWEWENLSFWLLQGLLELLPNHLFEHLENKCLFS